MITFHYFIDLEIYKMHFEIDHIISLSKGGLTTIKNLQLLARWENRKKGAK